EEGGLTALAGNAISYGNYGVQLFFVISGFILALPFARHHLAGGRRVSIAGYFKRRALRLEPTYLINLAILHAAHVLIGAGGVRADPGGLLPHLGVSAVYLHNMVYGESSAINGVAWSLEIEIQFYLLAPLL